MMDGAALYPNGFHPGRHDRSRSATRFVKGRLRLYAPPVFYYLIDFGLSKKYEGDGPHEAWGIDGPRSRCTRTQDEDAGPYDPFLLDIFTLGNVYKTSFLDVLSRYCFSVCLIDIVFLGISEPRIFAAIDNEDDATKAGRSPFNYRRRLLCLNLSMLLVSSVTQEEIAVIRRRTRSSAISGMFLRRIATWDTCLIISLLIGIAF